MKIAICDDDINISKNLSSMLKEIDTLHISQTDIFINPDALIFEIEKTPYDIVFMDIRLDRRSEIDISQKLLESNPFTHIIFISGYDDYYLDVYDVEHIYFLRKPISMEKLSFAVKRSKNKRSLQNRNMLTFNDRHGTVRIPMENIMFFEKNLRLIEIHLNSSYEFSNTVYIPEFDEYEYKFYGKFADLLPSLSAAFHQCHNSFIVNYNYVSEMTGSSFILNNKRVIPISKKFSSDIRSSFFEYIEG